MQTGWAFPRLGRRASCRPAAGSPRILVVGWQQEEAVAHAMGCLAPEAAVTFLPALTAARRFHTREQLLEAFAAHDAVFLTLSLPALRDGLAAADLRGSPRIALVPPIWFWAFHPDQVRVGPYDRPIQGPLGDLHSGLVLLGFLRGWPPATVLKLFDARVFARVGFFQAWDESMQYMRAAASISGLDLEASVARWMRQGCFMHSASHIKTRVAVDLARDLLRRTGLSCEFCNLEEFLASDPGRGESWPVYPELADHFGIPGSALFLRAASRRAAARSVMTLPAFIAESFAAYARVAPRVLVCPKVERWQADAALSADLDRLVLGV